MLDVFSSLAVYSGACMGQNGGTAKNPNPPRITRAAEMWTHICTVGVFCSTDHLLPFLILLVLLSWQPTRLLA